MFGNRLLGECYFKCEVIGFSFTLLWVILTFQYKLALPQWAVDVVLNVVSSTDKIKAAVWNLEEKQKHQVITGTQQNGENAVFLDNPEANILDVESN